MDIFNLPEATRVNKVISKNTFDPYTNAKQKKMFVDLIARITWLNKLSTDTINLEAQQIQEIQVFRIRLKIREDIKPLLDIIDKAIPYNIIFVVEYEGEVYLSTSVKHPHPINEDNAVIDWTFRSEPFTVNDNRYSLSLKRNIDWIYQDFCLQLSGKNGQNVPRIEDLVAHERQVDALTKEVARLKKSILACKQFNKKVELNQMLRAKEMELEGVSAAL